MGHTPGPWTIGGVPGNGGEAREIAASDRMVAWTASSWDDDEGDVVTEEDEANARLIAAAPELLAALKWLLPQWEEAINHEPDYMDMGDAARAAIAKAEGRDA